MARRYRIKSKFRFTLFMTVTILCVIAIFGTVFGLNTASSSSKTLYQQVQVQSGDTLWNIAAEYGPENSDPRNMIHEICDINEISADQLQAGQKILIPVYE